MDANRDRQVARARELFEAGDAHGAVHLLSEVVAAGGAFADAYHLLGLAFSVVGRRDDALAQLDRALALNPRYVDAHLNRAVLLNDMGRYEEAAAAFAAAQELGRVDDTGFSAPMASRLANLHAELAEAYVEAGGLDDAIRQLETAVHLRPSFIDLRYRLARLLLERGEFARGRAELEGILRERPAFVDARASLGMACYLLGDKAAARAVWEECRQQSPKDPRISAYLALLERVGG
jgi:tetratricopeptide (TPR) repeat protein